MVSVGWWPFRSDPRLAFKGRRRRNGHRGSQAARSPTKPTPSYWSEAHRLFLDSITKRRSLLSNRATHQHRVEQAIATAIGALFKTYRAPSISTRAIGSSTDQSRSSDFDGQRSALLSLYYSILRLFLPLERLPLQFTYLRSGIALPALSHQQTSNHLTTNHSHGPARKSAPQGH